MNKLLLVVALSLVFICCKTQQKTMKQPATVKTQMVEKKQEVRNGYFEMGLLDYEIIDTTAMDESSAQLMLSMITPTMEGVYVYNETSGTQISYSTIDSTVVSSEYFNSVTNDFMTLLYTQGDNYMFKSNTAEMMADMPQPSAEELAEFKELFKRDNNYNNSILGFKCDKVEMFEPDYPDTPTTVSYMTKDIPFMSNSFGVIGEMMGGFPIKIETNIGELIMTFGAKSHSKDDRYAKYLNVNESDFILLNEQEFAEKSYELLGR